MPPKKTAAAASGQGTLSAFIKTPAKKKAPSAAASTDGDETDGGASSTAADDIEDDEAVEDAPAEDGDKKRKDRGRPEDSHLPPLSNIDEIFRDIVKSNPDLKDVASAVDGRRLRVATMCSGTESPLLAMTMISQHMQALFGVTFTYDHVFSCEIEPFKQAYIERNFRPPILFRDVCELGGEEA